MGGKLEQILAPFGVTQDLAQERAPMHLSAALDQINRNLASYAKGERKITWPQWKRIIHQVQQQVEQRISHLEGCSNELFDQLNQLSLEEWHPRLALTVHELKEILLQKEESLLWNLKRLEGILQKTRQRVVPESWLHTIWLKLSSLWTAIIPDAFVDRLGHSQNQLRAKGHLFSHQYESYLNLVAEAQQHEDILVDKPCLATLETEKQERYLKLALLLNILEINQQKPQLVESVLQHSIEHAVYPDKAITLLGEYCQKLGQHLYQFGDERKRGSSLWADASIQNQIVIETEKHYKEAKSLHSIIQKYQTLFRKQFWFLHRKLGEIENPPSKDPLGKFLEMVLDKLETRSRIIMEWFEELKQHPAKESVKKVKLDILRHREVVDHLSTELSQPLADELMLQEDAFRSVGALQELQELISTNPEVVPEMTRSLFALLRADWRYHMLHEQPKFHALFELHQGLVNLSRNGPYSPKIERFHELLKQIAIPMRRMKVVSDFHYIEGLSGDLRALLQDILGNLQAGVSSGTSIELAAPEQQKLVPLEVLVELHYWYGTFIHEFCFHQPYADAIRRQMLFVDQYLETMAAHIKRPS